VSALHLVRHWVSVRQPDRALAELDGVRPEEAVSLEAAQLRSLSLCGVGRAEDAVEAARTGLATHGPDPVLLYILGVTLTGLGRLAEAERALLDALAASPEDAELLCGYAHLCALVGQTGKAASLVERAAASEPENPTILRTRVIIATARGDDAEADRLSRELLSVDPEGAESRSVRAMVAAYRMDLPEAYRSIRYVAGQQPDDRDAVEAARQLRIETHWLLWPMRPLYRYGPFKIWIGVVALMLGLRAAGLVWAAVGVALCWAVYCVYSWTVPPLVRYVLRRRA
jgi:Flp pilus assembly protein TadD